MTSKPDAPDEPPAFARSFEAALIGKSLDGIITSWSEGAEHLFGYRADEIIGRSIHLLAAPGREAEMDELLARTAKGETFDQFETIRRRKNGSLVRVLLTLNPVHDTDGRIVGISKIARDITEHRSTEARLRSIFDTAPDAVIVIDPRGTMRSFSQAAERMFGYAAEEVVGRNVSMLMAEPHTSAHDLYLARYLETGERRIIGIGREVEARRADGSTFPVELAVGEVDLPEMRLFTGFIRDVSKRKRLENDLAQAQKMEAVGQLTGGLAHDFNNLLAVISGNLEMLEGHVNGGEAAELLAEARLATERGAELAARLLAFGRRQTLRPLAIDVNDLVGKMAPLFRRTLGSPVMIETRLAADLPRTMADPGQIETALLNLALNARDAMPKGGRLVIETGLLHVDADYAAQQAETLPGNYVVLAVTDSGIGMSAETRAHAFEPFFTTKDVGEGSGLGLSMVYGFVKQSGGHVQIYSEPGLGTTVRLFLPAIRADMVATAADEVAPVPPPHRGMVLVVEDDPAVRRVAERRLARLGYSTINAATGAAGIAALQSHPEVAVLFTDVVLAGGMSGLDLAIAARVARPELPVLFTSGYGDPVVLRGRALPAGAIWLQKPYAETALANALATLLRPVRDEGV